MTEIPEHLLKRAQAARDKSAAEAGAAAAASSDAPAADPRIPAHLLERADSALGARRGGAPPRATQAQRADGGSQRRWRAG